MKHKFIVAMHDCEDNAIVTSEQRRIQDLGGGGAGVWVWQGVGRSSRRGRPGEGARGGHPSRPARGYGRAL